MKHIKLFENWLEEENDTFSDSKYELKPGVVFKPSGEMTIKNVDELTATELYFQEKGYTRRNLFEEDYPLVFVWAIDKKYVLLAESFARSTGSFKEDITFNDWFQLKHDFRGHKMKKFGI